METPTLGNTRRAARPLCARSSPCCARHPASPQAFGGQDWRILSRSVRPGWRLGSPGGLRLPSVSGLSPGAPQSFRNPFSLATRFDRRDSLQREQDRLLARELRRRTLFLLLGLKDAARSPLALSVLRAVGCSRERRAGCAGRGQSGSCFSTNSSAATASA